MASKFYEKILFPGTSDPKNAKKLVKITNNIKLGKIIIKKFACGETYVRLLNKVYRKKVFIYQTLGPKPNEIIIETLLIAQAATEDGAKEITLIFPSLPYSRQNKKTSLEKIEPISAELLAKLFNLVGIKKIITCHLHSQTIKWFYKNLGIKIIEVKPFLLFAKEIKKFLKNKKEWEVVAPDKGSLNGVKLLAKILGNLDFAYFEKQREDPAKKTNKVLKLSFCKDKVKKKIILFDDMVDTGETVIKAKERLNSLGTRKIILAATHPILSGRTKEKLEKAGFFKIFFSNSIPLKTKIKNLKIVDLLPEIKKCL